MIAIGIITIGLLALVATTPIQTRAIKRARAVCAMNEIAQRKIDEVRSRPFAKTVPVSEDIPVRFTDNDVIVTYTYHMNTVIDVFAGSTYLGDQSLLDNAGATKKVIWVKIYDPNDRIQPPRVIQLETTVAKTQ